MNKWIKQGVIGLALTSASFAAYAEGKVEAKESEAKLNAIETFGAPGIDALDYAGGSKLKDRMIQSSGKAVEFTTLEKIKA